MSYRAHVTVIDPVARKRVGLTALKRLFPNGLRYDGYLVGRVGTRNGTPGIWIERPTRDSFVTAIRHAAMSVGYVGCDFRVYTTNKPSDEAAKAFAEYAGRA